MILRTKLSADSTFKHLDMNVKIWIKGFRVIHIDIEEALTTFKLVHFSLLRPHLLINVLLEDGTTVKVKTYKLDFINNGKQINGTTVSTAENLAHSLLKAAMW